MSEKMLSMLELQDAMNKKVHPNWVAQNFEWYRAIWIECAELMDHHGWKWWKHQKPDLDQIKLELVDIWHFGLSILIAEMGVKQETADVVDTLISEPVRFDELLTGIEIFAGHALETKHFSVAMFAGLIQKIDMSYDELYRTYVGKNVLNFFRQDNGYKDGSYIKVWAGQEDNEHLVEVVAALDSDKPGFQDDVYQQLQLRYTELALKS